MGVYIQKESDLLFVIGDLLLQPVYLGLTLLAGKLPLPIHVISR
jgi:hypothetical protein